MMSVDGQRPGFLDVRRVREALEWLGVGRLCEALGLAEGAVPQGRGLVIRCPWHDDHTPSCSVFVTEDRGIGVRCHGCQKTGDVFALVAQVRGLDVARDFRAAVRAGAELAGVDVFNAKESAPCRHAVSPRTGAQLASDVPPPRAPSRSYPPRDEVELVWQSGVPVSDDEQVSALLRLRGIDALNVADLDLARALPSTLRLPGWARFRGAPWTRIGYRLVLPMFDAEGRMRNLRAWRVTDGEGPKRLSCGRTGGLVLADPLAQTLLRGDDLAPAWSESLTVVIAEGEPDYLTWTATFGSGACLETAPAVFGLFSGAWTDEIAARIPSHAEVAIRTHHDEAGEKYARQVYATLHSRVRRIERPQ